LKEEILVSIPIKTVGELNVREHWAEAKKRHDAQKMSRAIQVTFWGCHTISLVKIIFTIQTQSMSTFFFLMKIK